MTGRTRLAVRFRLGVLRAGRNAAARRQDRRPTPFLDGK